MESGRIAQATHCAMDIVMIHQAFGVYAEEALIAVCREGSRLEERLSCYLPDSEIGWVNRSAGLRGKKVWRENSDPLSEPVGFSLSFPSCSDLTTGLLVSLWKSGLGSSAQSDDASIRQLLPLVDYRVLIPSPRHWTAGLAVSDLADTKALMIPFCLRKLSHQGIGRNQTEVFASAAGALAHRLAPRLNGLLCAPDRAGALRRSTRCRSVVERTNRWVQN